MTDDRPPAQVADERTPEEIRAHDAFVRWQHARHTQFGNLVNVVLTLTTAALGFGVNLLVGQKIPRNCGCTVFNLSLIILFAAVALGLVINWSRLQDLRETAKAARKRELEAEAKREGKPESKQSLRTERKKASLRAEWWGKVSYWLLFLQCASFFLGAVLLVVSLWSTS